MNKTRDPGTRTSEAKIGGGLGIASILLLLAGMVSGPSKLISTNSPVTKIAANVAAHTQQVALSDTFVIIGAMLFIGYASVVARQLRTTPRLEASSLWLMGAAITFAFFGVLDNLVLTVMTFVSRQQNLAAEPALTRTLYHLYNGILMPGVAHLGLAALFTIVAAAAHQGALTPRWLRWPCTVLAPIALLNGIVGLTASNGGAFPVAPLAVLGFVIVVLANSTSMLRGSQPRTEPAIQPIGTGVAP